MRAPSLVIVWLMLKPTVLYSTIAFFTNQHVDSVSTERVEPGGSVLDVI